MQAGWICQSLLYQLNIYFRSTFPHLKKKTYLKHKEFYLQSTKGYWTPDKDKKLIQLVKFYGGKLSWNQLAFAFPGVKGKHIRQRYRNHLDPNLRQTQWTWEEDQVLKKCYIRLGNCWEQIARHLPGRSANQVKNRIRRKQFRDLFQPTEPTGPIPKSYMPQSFKKTTILEQQTRIELKKQHNNRMIREQIQKEKDSDLLQEPPMPLHMIRQIQNQKKKQTSKAKRFTITLLHLHNTYKIIRERIAKRDTNQFFVLFEHKSKKEIFATIQKIQWILRGIWPMLTNRNNTDIADQEMAYILFRMVQANTNLSNKILHRLIRCDNEEYLIKKFSHLVEEIGDFINFVSNTVREKQILEQNNQQQKLKIDIQNDQEGMEFPWKKEKKDKIKFQHEEGEDNNTNSLSSQLGDSEILQIWRNNLKNRMEQERNGDIELMKRQERQEGQNQEYQFDSGSQGNYDLAMLSKELTVGSQFDPKLFKDTIKKEQEEPVKIEPKPRKTKRNKRRSQIQELQKDNISFMSRAESECQLKDLEMLLLNSSDNGSSYQNFMNSQQKENSDDISDLDFELDIQPPNDETNEEKKTETSHQTEQEQSKGQSKREVGESESNEQQPQSNEIMKSVYMRELLRKKIKEIDTKEIQKIDLEDIEKARKENAANRQAQEVKLEGENEGGNHESKEEMKPEKNDNQK